VVNLVVSKFNISTRDAKGWIKNYRYFITADNTDTNYFTDRSTTASALRDAILGLSNAGLQSDTSLDSAQTVKTLVYGTNAQYPANWMEARMMFTTDKGARSVFGIGAPKVAVFDTDGITVLNDGTQALVVAYVAAVKTGTGTAFVSTEDGQAFTHFVGGILKIGSQPKRFNEMVKSSHLVAGEGE